METFPQDYMLQDTDLVAQFCIPVPPPSIQPDTLVYGPQNMMAYLCPYDPAFIGYGVGYVTPDHIYHEFGPRYRIPRHLNTGVYRPNIVVGEDWETGTYEILWKYQDTLTSTIQMYPVLFEVTSAGIYAGVQQYQDYRDLPATMIVIA